MTDLPLDHVRTLLVAVDAGTFEAAARVLHVTPSAVSQRIKALEQRTGRVLLVRSKPLRPTESGVAVVRFARQLAWLEDNARAELGLTGAAGGAGGAGGASGVEADSEGGPGERRRTWQTLSIAVNSDSLSTWFPEVTARFGAESAVCFDLHREDQDYTDELLRSGLVMAAISSSPKPVQGCTVRPLGHMRYRAVATHAFIRRWLPDAIAATGVAATGLAAALSVAPIIIFNRKDDLQDSFLRGLGAPASGPRHYLPATDAFLYAVESGLGWGLIPDVQRKQFGQVELVDLAPGRTVDVPLYWQQWKLAPPMLTKVGAVAAEIAARRLP
ncbi:LysR family transcriptional regulator ArgP [Catenulispora pinisilvae]|uniref:LysR family transcriptional regulator ArgP n=1 Tax=Catenulispora pinisilvae TaxID=2705253 RepID=UPI001891A2CA